MAGSTVVVFLSAGRCGTQWLATVLEALHPELVVEHEPLGPGYRPRQYFRSYADPEAILEVPEVAAHVAALERRRRAYVETGWPLFPVIPLLAKRIPERLRIVHLTRHPVPSALSHLVHKSYAGSPRSDAYTRLATLGPEDPGVVQSSYAACWERLTPYEKCLFWWTEVHLYGLELMGRIETVPLLRVKSEEMLSGDRETLSRMLRFIGLPWREAWRERSAQLVDRWHHRTDQRVDPLEIHRHPTTVEVARRLGYSLAGIDVAELEERYRGDPDPGLDRLGRFV